MIKILIKEIELRIHNLECDKYIDAEKRKTLIRENRKILLRCQQLWLDNLPKTTKDALEKEIDKGGYNYSNF